MVMKMKQGELLNIQILPQADDPSFEQRESGMAHTSYREETAFLSAIQQGDVERVKQLLGQQIRHRCGPPFHQFHPADAVLGGVLCDVGDQIRHPGWFE